jgi:hypothetical protein
VPVDKSSLKKLGLAVAALALLFLAWPLFSAWQLHKAVKTRDTAALETRVDWLTLRANLKPRITQAIEDDANASGTVTGILKRALGGAVAEKGIDLLVGPKTLTRILSGREFVTSRLRKDPGAPLPKAPPADAEQEDEDPDDPIPPRRLRWAFFESPSRFRIEAIHPRIPNRRIVAILGQQGLSWKLIDVSVK